MCALRRRVLIWKISFKKKSVPINPIEISYNEPYKELVITNPIGKFQKKIGYTKSYKESVTTNSIEN
ncbi:unnamed protein product [Rhizophagus irregularis]|nr:unnamed protein product [Rhizophagus irregularis]